MGLIKMNEEMYENSLLELFQNLGYTHFVGYDIERDYKNPLFVDDLENIYLINRGIDAEAVDVAIQKILDLDSGSLEERNDIFNMNFLIINFKSQFTFETSISPDINLGSKISLILSNFSIKVSLYCINS